MTRGKRAPRRLEVAKRLEYVIKGSAGRTLSHCSTQLLIEALAYVAENTDFTPRWCSQCGKTFRSKPCGFSHAAIGGWEPKWQS